MDVLFCTTMFDHSMTGAGRFAQCVAQITQSNPEIRIHILSEDVEHNPEAHKYHVQLSRATTLRYLGYWNKSREYTQAIARIVKAQTIDVIFFNDAWLAYHWLKEGGQIAVVVSVKDDNALQLWKNSIGGIPGLALRRVMEKSACISATAVITNSAFMSAALVDQYGVNAGLVHIVNPAYVEYQKIHFSILPIPEQAFVKVLFVKNDFRRGGLNLLLNALGNLKQYQFILTVVGPEASRMRKELELHPQPSNVGIDIKGRVYSHDTVLRLMKEHHIFCVPASQEAFGTANIEALASGLRIVYYPVGGIAQELRAYAFPIEERTPLACAQGILKAIECEMPELVFQLSAGRAWVVEHFSTEKMISHLETILFFVHQTEGSASVSDERQA